jgi:hypothetical protein
MEINGPRRIETSTVRRAGKTASGSSSSFQVSDAGEARGAVVSGPGPIGALDSILMLQGLDDSTDGRSRATAHGEALLDMLDQVRDGLLAGGVPRATLNRLANAVMRRHDQFNDPKLQGVLDEIELRAHVELAKLEMMDQRVA